MLTTGGIQLSNPTNAEDYEFAFHFSVKGVKLAGPGDADTWYPNIQYGLRGAGDEPPPLIVQAYLMNAALNPDPESVRFSILYTDPVTWTEVSPEEVDALPGSVEDYSFAIMGDSTDENGAQFRLGLVGDGAYGLEVSLFTLPIYLDSQDQEGAQLRNVVLAHAPRINWWAWEMDA
ncbi:gp22 [Mycobacterium phage Che9c]|uniref:Uncharacterized protein n=2 Tax=Caudoviricetes TaxID=2731619 RepID=Q854X5_9CAUD|nr:gp22 [Mycobacterium phage Che9c]YP_009125405.1 hypothetical protein VC74_gp22 [Mycobacterium phage Sparky]AAN12583.1 hypothetical protein PBI_CHE9C_22 [Mycobacterium phage Che9c]AII28170.1 hypothetical protein PBI_SPARKY_22 [Mycobacterium phage Sparky]